MTMAAITDECRDKFQRVLYWLGSVIGPLLEEH